MTTLGDICSKPQYGWTSRAAKVGKIKYVRTTDISGTEIDWMKVPYCQDVPADIEKYQIRSNDILVSRAGSVGVSARVADAPDIAIFASYLIRFKPLKPINPKYVEFFLKSRAYWRSISDFAAGIALPNINASKLSSLELPLPPLQEQARIVAKLQVVFDRLNSSQIRLDRFPALIKRLRRSILEAACSGRLTADWRSRVAKVQARQSMDELLDRLNPVDFDDPEDIFTETSDAELPDAWSWVKLGQLGQLAGGGTPSKEKSSFWNGNIPWVSPKDMKKDRISDSQDHISESAIENSSAKWIPQGSVLFVVRGMILNHTIPVAITDRAVTVNQDMKAIVPSLTEMSEYLFLASKNIASRMLFKVKEATHGTRRIETSTLKNWALPTPPLQEQEEIVRRAKALLARVDQIETGYLNAMKRINKMSDAILGKAFEGKLVTPEAEVAALEGRSFQSASDLLDQISPRNPSGNGNEDPDQNPAHAI